MKLHIKVLLLCLTLASINTKLSKAQLTDDSKKEYVNIENEKTVSLICMFNFSVLMPLGDFYQSTNNGSNNQSYSIFNVIPKLGFNTNMAIGFASKISKGIALENLLGFGTGYIKYNKIGTSVLGGISGTSIFIGEQNEKQIGNYIVLVNGITFSNSKKKYNKFYFSNYLFTSLAFNRVIKTKGFNEYSNSMFFQKTNVRTSDIYFFHTSHIVNYGFKIKNNLLKVGLGLDVYPFGFFSLDPTYDNFFNIKSVQYPFYYGQFNPVISTSITF